ncbi:insulin-like 3 (Leydig cell) [Megalops cyprinoides]|uniref:insulin-like 3 (Leydig cell) n=1 Tax=Megalops cyprinoides TaxID=118141 RepID=UPI00186469A6|nr:insulin-like 3 (Leydig cell) [Megalops cyprinoides]
MGPRWFVSLVVLLVIGHQEALGQDGRVKLCGREFIRMVVTSCGSSRLRRSAAEAQLQNAGPYGDMLEWLNSDEFDQLKGPENQDSTAPEGVANTLPSEDHASFRSEVTEENASGAGTSSAPETHANWSRTRRNAGPAGVCCRSGCTMSELVQYC